MTRYFLSRQGRCKQ